MSNGWKNSKHEDVVNSDLIKEVLETIFYRDSMGYKTSFQHVKAHKDSVGNIGADLYLSCRHCPASCQGIFIIMSVTVCYQDLSAYVISGTISGLHAWLTEHIAMVE
jgi:hypothetical protein